MILYGNDPSFKHSGVALIDDINKEIVLDEFEIFIDEHKPTTILDAATKLALKHSAFVIEHNRLGSDVYAGLELATTYGQRFQAELYALDYAIVDRLLSLNQTRKVRLYNTNYIRWLKEKKSTTKEDTIFLAQDMLKVFSENGYSIKVNKTEQTICGPKEGNRYPRTETITSGEADALMFAFRLYVIIHDDEIKRQLISLCPRLTEEKELQ